MTFEQFMDIVQTALLPGIAGLLWLVWRATDKAEAARDKAEQVRAAAARDLAEFKLEVAKAYVSTGYLKDVEQRLVGQLERIEAKLDARFAPAVPAE